MANHGRNRNGQFISRRVQNVQQLADLPDHEWAADEEAMAILEAAVVLAIKDGWVPPAVPSPEPNPGWDERAHAQDVVEVAPELRPDHDPWIDALKDGGS